MSKRKSQHRHNGSPASETAPPAYPRPLLEREQWLCLNGSWDFHLDPLAQIASPAQVPWDATIRVPFSPETPASGIGDTRLYAAVWYRRTCELPARQPGERVLLHFGAVDYAAQVWINGQFSAAHEGGYTPFHIDITELLTDAGPQEIILRAFDDPHDLAKPRGKQDWQPRPHSIWYYRTTGIWQTVWIEVVPQTYLASLRWYSHVEQWTIGIEAHLGGAARDDLRLRVRLRTGDRLLADDTYALTCDELRRHIVISDPGIDDYRNELLWHPDRPNLIDAEVELIDADGAIIDRVLSYTAMRSIALLGDRFVLNGKPLALRLVLNQGYWEQTGLTAPDDAALRRDIQLIKQMGFNGCRMHQKIEDPRFLYWADRLGLLVWEEMPSAYRFCKRTAERVTRQWTEAILRDMSHPCIIAWVPVNESWGVPDLPDSPEQRHFIQALYHLTKTLDPSRPALGNDGWESAATDIIGVHDYDADPDRIARRYGARGQGLADLLQHERPGNKVLLLQGFEYRQQPIVLTEFGGIAFSERAGTWGYSRAENAHAFAEQYYRLLSTVRSLPLLAGFCYTQFTDTYQEANGLLYMDRTPKFPIDQIATATRGAHTPSEQQIESAWRTRLMRAQHTRESIETRKLHAET